MPLRTLNGDQIVLREGFVGTARKNFVIRALVRASRLPLICPRVFLAPI
jgi:hypothetical protein